MRRIRAWWPEATILCVSHDLEETQEFPRVIVIEGGAIVQDGAPAELLADATGAYATMLARERAVHARLWRREDWRRLTIAEGRLREEAG